MAIFVDSKLQVHKRKAARKSGGALQLISEADPGKADVVLTNHFKGWFDETTVTKVTLFYFPKFYF